MTGKWPAYKVANDDAVYALGVMNINYVRFEATLVYMLAAIANIKQNQAAVSISRAGAAERATLIKVFANKREWPAEASAGIEHYLKAVRTLTGSRNALIHGNLVDIWKDPGIITMDHEGLSSVTQLSVGAIRQVADDIEAFGGYGYMLACYLSSVFSKQALEAGMAAQHASAFNRPAHASASASTKEASSVAPGRREGQRWPRLSEQIFRVDKWSVCRG